MKDVVIETERLRLKSPVGVIEAEDVFQAINHGETLQYLTGAPKNYQIEDGRSFLNFLTAVEDSDKTLQLGVFEKSMALLEKLGFVKKELRVAREKNDGVFVDQYRFLLEKSR